MSTLSAPLTIETLCVFCGAQNVVAPHFLEMGTQFGELITQHNYKMVYGGGDCGIMGAVANACMETGGHVTGVFPIHLRNIEREHKGLSETVIVGSMHERKKLMFDLSQAFIILPGGFGTMDEMFEILTWRQLQLHARPVIIVNYKGYWNPLITLMDEIIREKFARAETADFYTVVDTAEEVCGGLKG